ncbi:hypothetical protein BAY61_03690 [Prauserella marina]|uniref:Uncharacterized protein n=1 Tax=Prauserella marina TaxID=530584 RepID=A0A222VJZ1_9PSEU|nr:hypothetical protein [Prauserella marina]ASR34240.1 hypothetical protein BAY61_03690 [Prauserella marina]PWV71995.1 hypothetical protein DES30_111166 [Prauserella marina]SDD92807.1 hypothetical protein SAMN05421630_114165 [Prauserella marina]
MTWLWLGIAGVVLVAGAVLPVVAVRKRRRPGESGEEISARSRYLLLGHYVEKPVSTSEPVPRGLLNEATERWHSAGAALAEARHTDDFTLAKRIADEGIAAVAKAHALLGIPGPEQGRGETR